MRTTVDIETTLLRALRDQAHAAGISFKDLLNRVIRRGIKAPPGLRRRVRLRTHSLGITSTGINLDQALRLAAALEDEETVRTLHRGG